MSEGALTIGSTVGTGGMIRGDGAAKKLPTAEKRPPIGF
jgi:hypothetical protein